MESILCFVFLCHQSWNSFTVFEFFFFTRFSSCQFQSEPSLSRRQLQLIFWCISILMCPVSSLFCQQEGHITDKHWKCSYKAVKTGIFKTSIKYMLKCISTLSITLNLISIDSYLYFQTKAEIRIAAPSLNRKRRFINLHAPIMNFFSFVFFNFVLQCSEQRKSCCHFLSRLVRTWHQLQWTRSCGIFL